MDSEAVDEEFPSYIDKLVYYASDGNPAGIVALESRKTFIEFLSIVDNHLDRVNRIIEQNKKNEKLLRNQTNGRSNK